MDAPDIARHLREDGRLLGRKDVGRRGELHLEVAARRHDHAHQGVAPGSLHGARLLVLQPVGDENPEDDRQAQQGQADPEASQPAHRRLPGLDARMQVAADRLERRGGDRGELMGL